ncbi:hypothetical protein [Bartonella senegalensis]|uniref:hypothetical protein n=1 Tax=Bartonella senegalensis TaxID=1468418 RepID=UPI00054E9043|nr:hypothetical protein [Bartonella senegalensis]
MKKDSYHSMKRGLALSLAVHVVFLTGGVIHFINPVSLPQQLEAIPLTLVPVNEELDSQQGALNAPVRAIPAVKPTTKPQEKEDAHHFGEGQIDSSAPFKPKEKPRSVETTPSPSGEEKVPEKSLPETKAEEVPEKPLEVAEKVVPAPSEDVHPEVAEKVVSEPSEDVRPAVAEKVVPAPSEDVHPAVAEKVVPAPSEDVHPAVAEKVVSEPSEDVRPAVAEKVVPAPSEDVRPAVAEKVVSEPSEDVRPAVAEKVVSESSEDVRPAVAEKVVSEPSEDVRPAVAEKVVSESSEDVRPAVAEKVVPEPSEDVRPAVAEKVVPETAPKMHKNKDEMLPQDLAQTVQKVPVEQEATRSQHVPKIALPEKSPFPQFKPKPVKESAVQNAQAVKKHNQHMKEKTIEDILAMEENNLLNRARSQGGGAKRSSEPEALGARKNINDTTKMAQTLVSIVGGCIQKKLKLVALGGDLKNRPVVRLRFYLNREGMVIGDPIIDPLSGEQSQQAIMIRQVYAAVFSCQPYTDLPRDQYDLWGQGFDFNVDPLQEIIR